MLLTLKSSLSEVTETIKLEGNALITPIDMEDLNAFIREFAQDNEITESSVSYEVLPDHRNIRLYLLDENEISPCIGVDEEIELTENESVDLAKKDFAHHLVAHEGFEFSEVPGFDVQINGIDYKVIAD